MEIEEEDLEVLEAAGQIWDDLVAGIHYGKQKKACQEIGFTYKEMKGEGNG
jgi:hypothetical protein